MIKVIKIGNIEYRPSMGWSLCLTCDNGKHGHKYITLYESTLSGINSVMQQYQHLKGVVSNG